MIALIDRADECELFNARDVTGASVTARSCACGRRADSVFASRSKFGSASIAFSASGSLRHQFGCWLVVPGMLTCSISPSTSSSCTIMICDGVDAMKA